jgi:HlyD family secretion protein
MKKKNKIIIIVSAIVLVIAIVVIYFIYQSKHKPYVWKTVPMKKGDVIILVKSTGTINPDTTVQVGTQVTGTIWKLFADFNTVVKKGQVIAVLDTTFLSASRIDAQAALARAQATLDQAQRDYDRNKQLLNEKVVAQADYETTLTTLAVAKGSVISAKAQLNHARVNLQYAVITSPVNGVVISRSVDLGQTVVSSFNTPNLFSIANDLSIMQVQAAVDEADIGQVKEDEKATFTVDAFPDEIFHGEIEQVRLQPIIVQNVVNYNVIINVPNPDLKLKPGLTANISIHVQEHKDVLKVPANALTFIPPDDYLSGMKNIPDSVKTALKKTKTPPNTENGGFVKKTTTAYLWILKGKELIPKKVSIGLSDGNFTEVSGDINVGDEVVTGQMGPSTTTTTAKSPFMPQMPGGRK